MLFTYYDKDDYNVKRMLFVMIMMMMMKNKEKEHTKIILLHRIEEHLQVQIQKKLIPL